MEIWSTSDLNELGPILARKKMWLSMKVGEKKEENYSHRKLTIQIGGEIQKRVFLRLWNE